MKKARKGFTLVELLIVVAILGVLSAAMMMASQDATPKAQARQIAANLKTMAVGVSVYLSDSADKGVSLTYFKNHSTDYVFGTNLQNYSITSTDAGDPGGKWYVSYTATVPDDVANKLHDISADSGLEAGTIPKMRVK